VKISGQAMALQMTAAKLWGMEHYERLDPLTVLLGHPDAMQAMLSGQSVNSRFAVAPFNYRELAVPSIHVVLKTYDTVGGKHTNGIQVTSKSFHDANPGVCIAVREAHERRMPSSSAIRSGRPRSTSNWQRTSAARPMSR
jgi:NitT/TauT family transport system substrate-binding protein